MQKEMKPYIVDAGTAASDLKKFSGVREAVKDIVEQAGGEMVKDAAGFGLNGHPEQHSHLMLVRVPEETVAKLRAVPGVDLVAENKRRIIPKPGKTWHP